MRLHFPLSGAGGAPPVPSGPSWFPLPIGGGGFVAAIDIANDGTTVVRTDTYGAYLRKPSQTSWTQLVTTLTMPAGWCGMSNTSDIILANDQCFGIAISPSNSNVAYMVYGERFWVCTNLNSASPTWQLHTNFPTLNKSTANGNQHRLMGRRIAVDPVNSDIVLVGTTNDGCYLTKHGTTSGTSDWTSLQTLTNGVPFNTDRNVSSSAPFGSLVIFDPSTSSGGSTPGMYASSYGNGVYNSTDGGSNWTLTSSGPTTHAHMICDANGTVWFVDQSNSNKGFLWKYSSGTWSKFTSGPADGNGNKNNFWAVAVSGSNVYVVPTSASRISYSNDGGSTWKTTGVDATRVSGSGDPAWLSLTNEVTLSVGDIVIDPSLGNPTSGDIILTEGIGVWTSPALSGGVNTTTWTTMTKGIENLVVNDVIIPPGGTGPLVAVLDRNGFIVPSPSAYTAAEIPIANMSPTAIQPGFSVDYAILDPGYCVVGGNATTPTSFSAISNNYGAAGSWTRFAAPSLKYTGAAGNNGFGGHIAMKDRNKLVWVPGGGGNNAVWAYYTTDGGNTWTICNFPGLSTTNSGWNISNTQGINLVCCDDNGRYWAVTKGGGLPGIWYSDDNGANFTQCAGQPASLGVYVKIRAVPGQTGPVHILFTDGWIENNGVTGSFYRCIDGSGTTWTAFPGWTEVISFGFGLNITGSGYPALFAMGWYNNGGGNQWQIARSDNAGDPTIGNVAWTKIGDMPNGWGGQPYALAGDPNNAYNCVLGNRDSGGRWYHS